MRQLRFQSAAEWQDRCRSLCGEEDPRAMLERGRCFREVERSRNVHAGPHQIAQTRLKEKIIVGLLDDVIDA
ncbi:MAG: hypothetical protein EBS68_11520 [Rhodobacteraceae bacterium]|nr:hypothetical protein [Paracoccaceae bacterium]